MSEPTSNSVSVQDKLKHEEMHLIHKRKTIAKTDSYLAIAVVVIYFY